MTESLVTVPKKYNLDTIIHDLKNLQERENLDAREYFKELTQERQNRVIGVVRQLIDSTTDAEVIRLCKEVQEVMTDA